MLHNFKITPARPDGMRIDATFVVDTWEDLHELMVKLDGLVD